MNDLKQTALHAEHLKLGAKMVEFAGWEMPIHYQTQITEEHGFVREDAGMFDVSHMGVIDITGKDVASFLGYVLANNIDKLKNPGTALYTCLLNHGGGVLDDLIVYYISPHHYRLVVNAATLAKDLVWLLREAANFDVSLVHQDTVAILAVQGPNAFDKLGQTLSHLQTLLSGLKPFQFFIDNDLFIARTGYTGENGFELIVPNAKIVELWQALLKDGVHPIGLGARDTLRLEAGLNLYGQDMNESVSPLESNLAWTVAFEPLSRDFIGRQALEQQQREGIAYKLTGLKLIDKGVLRHDQTVWLKSEQVGIITSGSYSPTLKQSIALARVRKNVINSCTVEVRGKHLNVEIIEPPFVRRKGR